jgi:sugar-specific transcriptional regulator TrmB
MNQNTELKENLYRSLNELGLTESESSLYITSLSLGPTSIAKLGEHLGISRPNVYKVISGLEKYGLAKFSDKKNFRKTFMVESPSVVLQKIRERREDMARLDQTLSGSMPDFLAMYHQGETPTKIKVFSGKEQWVKIFFEVLDEAKDEIKFFGSADAFIKLITWETEKLWIKKRVEKNIHINVLLTPGKDAVTLEKNDKNEMRTTRFFKDSLPFVTGFMIYSKKVIIWQPEAPLVILIDDEYVTKMLESMFYSLWSASKDPEK